MGPWQDILGFSWGSLENPSLPTEGSGCLGRGTMGASWLLLAGRQRQLPEGQKKTVVLLHLPSAPRATSKFFR